MKKSEIKNELAELNAKCASCKAAAREAGCEAGCAECPVVARRGQLKFLAMVAR